MNAERFEVVKNILVALEEMPIAERSAYLDAANRECRSGSDGHRELCRVLYARHTGRIWLEQS